MKIFKLLVVLFMCLSFTSCDEDDVDIKDIAVSQTIDLLNSKEQYTITDIDTVIVDSSKEFVYVLIEGFYADTKGYFVVDNKFYKDKVIDSYVSLSKFTKSECLEDIRKR